jgi:ribonuclease D
VDRARALPEAELPERPKAPPRQPRDPELEKRVDRLKSVRDAAAERLQLERGFLMARWQLEEIARTRPQSRAELAAIGSVRQWQIEALGSGLLEALN